MPKRSSIDSRTVLSSSSFRAAASRGARVAFCVDAACHGAARWHPAVATGPASAGRVHDQRADWRRHFSAVWTNVDKRLRRGPHIILGLKWSAVLLCAAAVVGGIATVRTQAPFDG